MKRSRLPPGKPPQRKTRLKSKTGFKPRKNYMAHTSTKAKERKRRQVEQYKDAHGLTFADVNGLLRPVGQWPFIEDVEAREITEQFRDDFRLNTAPWKCWLCGKTRFLDAAHIVPRSDERSNLVALCSCLPYYGYSDSCHTLTEKNWAMLPEVLKAKWEHDREHTSWMAIAIRRRQLFTFTDLD